jgi:hypothetical protein
MPVNEGVRGQDRKRASLESQSSPMVTQPRARGKSLHRPCLGYEADQRMRIEFLMNAALATLRAVADRRRHSAAITAGPTPLCS